MKKMSFLRIFWPLDMYFWMTWLEMETHNRKKNIMNRLSGQRLPCRFNHVCFFSCNTTADHQGKSRRQHIYLSVSYVQAADTHQDTDPREMVGGDGDGVVMKLWHHSCQLAWARAAMLPCQLGGRNEPDGRIKAAAAAHLCASPAAAMHEIDFAVCTSLLASLSLSHSLTTSFSLSQQWT